MFCRLWLFFFEIYLRCFTRDWGTHSKYFFFWFFGSVVDIDTANKALNQVNGFIFKGKPVIIQYGKQRTDLCNKNAPGLSSPGSST